jgi:hypothetical protein
MVQPTPIIRGSFVSELRAGLHPTGLKPTLASTLVIGGEFLNRIASVQPVEH